MIADTIAAHSGSSAMHDVKNLPSFIAYIGSFLKYNKDDFCLVYLLKLPE